MEPMTAELMAWCNDEAQWRPGYTDNDRARMRAIAARLSALDKELTDRNLSSEYSSPSVMVRRIAVERDELRTQLTAALARAEKAEKERDALRIQLAACASDATAALTEIRFDGQTVFGTLYAKPGEEPI